MADHVTHSHNYQHFEDLQLSATDFYKKLALLIQEYKFPDVSCDFESFREGGIFSSSRQYLAIKWKEYTFYVCASPFGKCFFISWWLRSYESDFDGFLRRLFRGKGLTFYEVDTENIFQSAIHAIIQHAIQQVKNDNGYRMRQLTE